MEIGKLKAYVKDAIKEMVEKGEMFSAWDVCKKVREICNTVFPHREDVPLDYVKADISTLFRHDAFASMISEDAEDKGIVYNRTSVILTNGKKTMVYHPLSVDPYTYYAAAKMSPVSLVADLADSDPDSAVIDDIPSGD